MARQPTSNEDDVSLFPFLSVLACIIGTLTLMIAALALGEMDNETVISSEQYEQVQQRLTTVRAEVDQLKKLTAGASDRRRELAAARASLKALEQRIAAAKKESGEVEPAEPMPEIDLPALEKELAELADQVKKLEQLVAQRNRPPEEAEVVIKPGGSGVDIDPRFVECRSDSIVIYADKEPLRIPKSQIGQDANFVGLLEKVAKSPRASVVFLIRDDGIGTYAAARGVAQAHYAKNGKLPVLGHGKIDLSLFEPKS